MVSLKLIVVLALVLSAATARVLTVEDLRVRRRLLAQHGALGIYGGNKTTIQKHPYLVSILLDGGVYCAGSIMSERWALTTGSCVAQFTLDSFTVIANSPDGYTGTVYKLSQYIVHPKYDEFSLDYDFGCIKIDGKFKWSKTAHPIRLPRRQPKVNSLLKVAGYGSSDYVDDLGLREVWMPWSPKKPCADYYGHMTPRKGCSFTNGTAALCTGDFADGFVKNGVIYAMFSTVDADHVCDPTWPYVLSNIKPVTGWIKEITGAKYEDEY